MFNGLLEEILNESVVSMDDVNKAIDNHDKLIVTYTPVTPDRKHAIGARLIGVFAYGQTKASNDCIRVFEYAGDTASFVPGWKLLRLDQIKTWKNTGQTFDEPPAEFNPNGDRSMSIVFKVAKFGEDTTPEANSASGPKTNDIFMTDTEKELKKRGMKLKNQLNKPIYLSDLKTKEALKPYSNNKTEITTGPKTNIQQTNKPESYKDEVAKMFAPLRDKIANAKKIDLQNNNLKNEPAEEKPEYKKEVEDMFSPLKDKIANAQKIDLSKIKDPRKRNANQKTLQENVHRLTECNEVFTIRELRTILSERM